MKQWSLLAVILLMQQSNLLGQTSEDLIIRGEAALNDNLWEVAESHFKNALSDQSLTPEKKSKVTILLAETLVHEGNASEVLDLLGKANLYSSTDVLFWRALALTSQRRFSEAIPILTNVLSDTAYQHRIDAACTLASLHLSLDQPDAALESLSRLITDSEPGIEETARLYQVEILHDLGRIEDARHAMPEKESIAPKDLALADFLESQLQLKEGHPKVAESGFRGLINQSLANESHSLSLIHLHMANIGLADALHAQGDPEGATKSLLAFIQDQPNSPMLESIFSRILQWLPEKPSITDPVLERLSQWIPAPTIRPTFGVPGALGENAISAWTEPPVAGNPNTLLAFSLYTRAVGLHRIPTPEAQAEAKRLLFRLRLEFPTHPLVNRSLYLLARWNLNDKSSELAIPILETVKTLSQSQELKGQSAYLEALASYENGDFQDSIRLFDEASNYLVDSESRSAKLQSAIVKIRNGDASSIQLDGNPGDKELLEDIELEKALSTNPPDAKKSALDAFITNHPDHPRIAEACLAAAEAALASQTPDIEFARSQLDYLKANPENTSKLPQARIALANLRIADLTNDSPATIAAAQSVIDNYPNLPEASEAKFLLGKTLFQAGNYNSARLTLEDLAAKEMGSPRAQAAWLLAARSAALGGTEASRKEALILFDNAIKAAGPVTEIASLEKARHLIDMVKLDEARQFLTAWIAKLPADDPLQVPAGLLLGEALSSGGVSRPESLGEALAVYDKLLAQIKNYPVLSSRLQYLRGQTLEQMPDPNDPAKMREKEAFQAYHSVLEATTPPAEWEYFELCGFHALELLEKAKRWQAAINVARKIASFKGPRSGEAAARASEIQLKQRIWED